MSEGIDLGLVGPILKAIARVVGCDVSCYSVSLRVGHHLYLDLLDDAFAGRVPRAELCLALGAGLARVTGQTVTERRACPNEGGVLSLQILQTPDGVDFRVGV